MKLVLVLVALICVCARVRAFSENPADYEMFGLMAPFHVYEGMNKFGGCLSIFQLAEWADAITQQGAHDHQFLQEQLKEEELRATDHSELTFASAANAAYIVQNSDIPQSIEDALVGIISGWRDSREPGAVLACKVALIFDPSRAHPAYWKKE